MDNVRNYPLSVFHYPLSVLLNLKVTGVFRFFVKSLKFLLELLKCLKKT